MMKNDARVMRYDGHDHDHYISHGVHALARCLKLTLEKLSSRRCTLLEPPGPVVLAPVEVASNPYCTKVSELAQVYPCSMFHVSASSAPFSHRCRNDVLWLEAQVQCSSSSPHHLQPPGRSRLIAQYLPSHGATRRMAVIMPPAVWNLVYMVQCPLRDRSGTEARSVRVGVLMRTSIICDWSIMHGT